MADYDYSKLKGRIVEKFVLFGNFARAMHWSGATMTKKMSCRVPWTQKDIHAAIHLLDLTAEDIPAYFFTEKV